MAQAFRIVESNQTLQPVQSTKGWQNLTNDEARGLVWMFEAPQPKATYIVSCDPAQGLTGWDRTIPQDSKVDNSAVEVFRITKQLVKVLDDKGDERTVVRSMDFQVAEWAAPVDYEGTAAVINALGRIYKGSGSMGVAHAIIEVYPGPGWLVEKTLIGKFGYLNFYSRKYIDTLTPQASKGIGWVANRQSVRDLWIHGTRHVENRQVTIRSPWLLSEMKTTDPIKFMEYTSEAASGFHDDRLRAAMLNWWAAHDASSQITVRMDTTIEKGAKAPNWQASDMSSDRLSDEWNKRFREIADLS